MDEENKVEPPEYPSASLPTIYVDAVTSIVWSPEVVKFYVGRFDPDFGASSIHRKRNPFAQVVMPTSSFVYTAMFFQNVLGRLLKDGTITQEMIDSTAARTGERGA